MSSSAFGGRVLGFIPGSTDATLMLFGVLIRMEVGSILCGKCSITSTDSPLGMLTFTFDFINAPSNRKLTSSMLLFTRNVSLAVPAMLAMINEKQKMYFFMYLFLTR